MIGQGVGGHNRNCRRTHRVIFLPDGDSTAVTMQWESSCEVQAGFGARPYAEDKRRGFQFHFLGVFARIGPPDAVIHGIAVGVKGYSKYTVPSFSTPLTFDNRVLLPI
jgi:hypothetical protein